MGEATIGSTRVENGRVWKLYEIELEGEKWMDIGPAPTMPADSPQTIAGCGRCLVNPAKESGLCETCELVLSPRDMVPEVDQYLRMVGEQADTEYWQGYRDALLLAKSGALSVSPVGEGALQPSASVPTERGDDPWAELERLARGLGGIQDWRLVTDTEDAKRIGPYVVRHAVGAVAAVPRESPITSGARAYMAFIAAANPSTILALLSERQKMVEALEDMRDAWLKRFGCFPGDRYSPETRLYSRAMSRTYEIVGQGTEAERKAKLEALAQEIEAERVERRGRTFNFAAALTGSREQEADNA